MSEQNGKKAGQGWFSYLVDAINGTEEQYEKLSATQRKILAGRGFAKKDLGALLRVRDRALLPLLTGKGAPERAETPKGPSADPLQTDIMDFIGREEINAEA
jgi:hypothetical protein